MKSFDLPPQPRIVFGNGAINQLGQFAATDDTRRALVVSDPGVVAAGHTARGMEALKNVGIEPHLFDEVRENPTTEDVERGVVAAQCVEPQMIIGIGGGSSMDCAKGINFVFSCGGTMEDYWGIGKATGNRDRQRALKNKSKKNKNMCFCVCVLSSVSQDHHFLVK